MILLSEERIARARHGFVTHPEYLMDALNDFHRWRDFRTALLAQDKPSRPEKPRKVGGLTHSPTCTLEGCGRPYYAKGICKTCYAKAWYDTHLRVVRVVVPCSEDGCERSIHAKGLCSMHYRRAKRAKAKTILETGLL